MNWPIMLLLNFYLNTLAVHGTSEAQWQCERSEVLILGAGMAGISAGAALSNAGITDFKIIEYQDRIGGRTLSTDFGFRGNDSSWTVEFGTNWIVGLHSENGSNPQQRRVNPIWRLAQEVNMTTLNAEVVPRLYNEHGQHDWNDALDDYYAASERAAKLSKKRIGKGDHDISQWKALELTGWNSTNDMYRQAAEALLGDFNAAVPAYLSSAYYSTFAGDAAGGTDLGPYSRFVVDQRGYDTVTKHLASKYLAAEDSRLVLNSPVTEIHYTDDGVVARTNDSCYAADYAISTFSLGVLQQGLTGDAPVSFVPALPSWKAQSISLNVMGIYTKIFYQFKADEVFWPKEIRTFFYASPTQKGWWPIWLSLDFPGSPLEGSGIIFATMIWDQSRQIEQQTDDTTMRQGLQVLQQMFPDATIPKPTAFKFPRWSTTPWAYGSYPAWAKGYTPEEQANLRANLGRLWFAGDATSPEYWGYLHGAYYEGQLAGKEIAACLEGSVCEDRSRYPKSADISNTQWDAIDRLQDALKTLFDDQL